MNSRRARFSFGRALCLGVALVGVGLGAWVGGPQLWAWHCVAGLARASDRERAAWLEKIAALGRRALPALFERLRRDDEQACVNAGLALAQLAEMAPPAGPGAATICEKLVSGFATFSPPGQRAALDLAARLLARDPRLCASGPDGRPVSAVLEGAARADDETVHAKGLEVTTRFVASGHPAAPGILPPLLRRCFHDRDAANRVAAIEVAGRMTPELLNDVTALLPDPVAEVRRAALLCVGTASQAVATDDLLPWLHDPDAGARAICEAALKGRGLSDAHLRLARLLTSPDPAQRLRVIDIVRSGSDLEPGVWLRRLSHDRSPAVRAAALRAAAGKTGINLRDRIEQMVQDDPSPTIRQLAKFYLKPPESGRGQ